METTSIRYNVLVLSTVFVTVVFCIGFKDVNGLPVKDKPFDYIKESNKTSPLTDLQQIFQLSRISTKNSTTGKDNESDENISKSLTSNSKTNTRSKQSDKNASDITTEKLKILPPLEHNEDALLSVELNTSNEVVKRNSLVHLIDSNIDYSYKPIQIKVETYTPPPDTSAVIVLRPEPVTIPETSYTQLYPEENPWYTYQFTETPQNMNPNAQAYFDQNQYITQPNFAYITTEELLHAQNNANGNIMRTNNIYQYPFTETYQSTAFIPSQPPLYPNVLPTSNQHFTQHLNQPVLYRFPPQTSAKKEDSIYLEEIKKIREKLHNNIQQENERNVKSENILYKLSGQKYPANANIPIYPISYPVQYPFLQPELINPITLQVDELNIPNELVNGNLKVDSDTNVMIPFNQLPQQNYPILLNNPQFPSVPAQYQWSQPDIINSLVSPGTELNYEIHGDDSVTLFSDLNQINNVVTVQIDPETTKNDGFVKYVTKSFYLKTEPKLEWVTL